MSVVVLKPNSYDELQKGSLDQIKEDYRARRDNYRGRRFEHFKNTFSKFEREYRVNFKSNCRFINYYSPRVFAF